MSRGKKLDLFIGADMGDRWSEVQTSPTKKVATEILLPQKHFLVFKKEKRRGKTVTLIGEFQIEKEEATKLLKKLKKKMGCGGTFKDGWMEFQGELKEKSYALLTQESFRFKHTL